MIQVRLEVRHTLEQFKLSVQLDSPYRSIAVIGPNGSGKSTFLRALTGALPTSDSQIQLFQPLHNGAGIFSPPSSRGYVPQTDVLFPHWNAYRNTEFALRYMPRDPKKSIEQVTIQQIMTAFNCWTYADRLPHQLSGGQRQRVALARAFAAAPDLVLLDEPFSALDVSVRGDVRQAVKSQLTGHGMASVIVTHDVMDVITLCEGVAVFNQGQLSHFGPVDALLEKPVCQFTSAFFEPVRLTRSGLP